MADKGVVATKHSKTAETKKPKSKGFLASLFGPTYELGKGRVVMISGCRDDQTSGDAKAFQCLPCHEVFWVQHRL